MPSPFPGMDPYLEEPGLWPDVHNEVIGALRALLVPLLRPRYYVAIEERTYADEAPELALVGLPDVAVVSRSSRGSAPRATASSVAIPVRVPLPHPVHETYLEVRGVEGEVVAVIEILSLSNKRAGEGRRLYLEKRRKVLASLTHLVEVDLLRAGERMPIEGIPQQGSLHLALVSPAPTRPGARLHAFGLREPLPVFSLPLREPGEEVAIDLGKVLATAYDRAAYDLRVDYTRPPQPPLDADDEVWADRLLREHGARR